MVVVVEVEVTPVSPYERKLHALDKFARKVAKLRALSERISTPGLKVLTTESKAWVVGEVVEAARQIQRILRALDSPVVISIHGRER